MILSSGLVVIVLCLGSTLASECENVYPHLLLSPASQNKESCDSQGGCWDAVKENCFFPKVYGYNFTANYRDALNYDIQGKLNLLAPTGALGPDFNDLNICIRQETKSRTHIKIAPTGVDKWEVPDEIIPRSSALYDGDDADTEVLIASTSPLEIVLIRKRDKQVIFILSKMLIFQDQYVQFVLGSPKNVRQSYGFGESSRTIASLEYETMYALWNTDNLALNFNQSLYGSHPFYLQVLDDGTCFGVMWMNSNAVQASLYKSDTQGDSVGLQSNGGIVDLYIFAGPTPSNVIAQYHEVIGRPLLPPYWSLGFHNCRWGYPGLTYVKEVVANYSVAGIPLETQWVDIDYMKEYKDFTTSPSNFPLDDLRQFVDSLHTNGQYFVPIIDPGIYAGSVDADDGIGIYLPRDEGLAQDVFVKDLNGENFVGWVWPGPTYYPDWFAPNTSAYWTHQLEVFHQKVPFDGIWIDMNEVSNFANDDGLSQVCNLTTSNEYACYTVDCENQYDFPPWVPSLPYGSLGGKTIPMSALHYSKSYTEGKKGSPIREYDAHNLYGLMESIATSQAVASVTNRRPFVLSRSTFPSSGSHVAHWTGDNAAEWEDLRGSVIKMSALSLLGMSMTGADICGFMSNTTEELCARWVEVGAFSPFMRSHNTFDGNPQELYRWESVSDISRRLISMRYQLLPHLYTLLYHAHTSGSTVMNALWVHYPMDPVVLSSDCDEQYMWSNGLLFTPVLHEGAIQVEGYFPAGIWYSLMEEPSPHSKVIIALDRDNAGEGRWVTLRTPLNTTNVHIRGGTIIPLHTTTAMTDAEKAVMTTTVLRDTPFTLAVALDQHWRASGSLYVDDGQQITNFRQNHDENAHASPYSSYSLMDYQVNPVGTVEGNEFKETGPVMAHGSKRMRLHSSILSSHRDDGNSAGVECCSFNDQHLDSVQVFDWNLVQEAAKQASGRRSNGSNSQLVKCSSSVFVPRVDRNGGNLRAGLNNDSFSASAGKSTAVPASFNDSDGLVSIDLSLLKITVSTEFIVEWECTRD